MATKAERYRARQRKFKVVTHSFTKKICHWMYCSGCGLVNLKNDATRKRMSQPCESMEE